MNYTGKLYETFGTASTPPTSREFDQAKELL